jgi:hypothetical protein
MNKGEFLNKTLTNSELDHLLNFIGYGRLDADIWFLGFEELGGTPNGLYPRVQFQQVEDSSEAQKILQISSDQFGQNNLQGAWRSICTIMLKLEGKVISDENIRNYFLNQLGRINGSTLICEFLPIPKSVSNWDYETIIPQYPSEEAYYSEIKKMRVPFFRELIEQNLPKIIICYGKSAWPEYLNMLNDFTLSEKDSFMLGWDANTVVILCDDFSAPEMSEKFDEMVALILENSLSIDIAKPSGPIPLSKAELTRQKKEAARKASAAKRKPSAKHNASDPFCVCIYCLGYENE